MLKGVNRHQKYREDATVHDTKNTREGITRDEICHYSSQ